jgi:hypothetical protein
MKDTAGTGFVSRKAVRLKGHLHDGSAMGESEN